MLLHAGPARESRAALQAACSHFAQLPGARVVHALLKEKGEPSAGDLCESLGLSDPGSIAAFSIDEPKLLRSALDALLTRLAP